jgi:hypothetical protein
MMGSLNRVVRIVARSDLTASQIIYRYLPQPVSRDYSALTDVVLPALSPPVTPGKYLLQLAEVIEGGHSWELPVLLAHLVVALDHELVTDPANADIVLWSTGELLDVSLGLRAGDYKLAQIIAYGRDELQQAAAAGARIIAIVPASEDVSPLRKVLTEIGAKDVRVESVDSVHAARRILEEELSRAIPIASPAA